MKPAKDLFSTQAAVYANFRPHYPDELYDFIHSKVKSFERAWDCGTGNGQVANRLAEKFQLVEASDVSAKQIEHATKNPKVNYAVCRGEQTTYPDHCFDLITVGTAIHWFDFDSFYKEVRRVAKPGALLAVWAYEPPQTSEALDAIMNRFNLEDMKAYWNPERKYVDDGYRFLPFPFEEISAPKFFIRDEWTIEQYIGYIQSWSAVQNYRNKEGKDPVPSVATEIHSAWGTQPKRKIIFPLMTKFALIN